VLLDSKRLADLVVGPDAYRDLPRILAAVHVSKHSFECTALVALACACRTFAWKLRALACMHHTSVAVLVALLVWLITSMLRAVDSAWLTWWWGQTPTGTRHAYLQQCT
jgi:hypothetical protein